MMKGVLNMGIGVKKIIRRYSYNVQERNRDQTPNLKIWLSRKCVELRGCLLRRWREEFIP